ncbi:MAG: hypothetical protein QOE93_963 [Actinomycetota bacterium]|jgi:hypothetical protein|nr:hypothetical protein [Actinomycetota bacterium]
MRRSRLHGGGRVHYEVAAVISVLGLAVMGRPLLAGGDVAEPLTIPASASLVAAVAAPPAPPEPAAPAAAAPPVAAPAPVAAATPPSPPPGPLAWFAPGGRNQGTENVAMALAAIALEGNVPLYLSDTWGRTWGSSTSDHYVGNTDAWAVDLAVRGIQQPTPQTEEAARRVAAALGYPDWTGGNLRVTIDGYRIQVLWQVAGHFNHVHVGVKRVATGG